MVEYLLARSMRKRKTLLYIFEEIAEDERVSSSAVKNAYRKHGPDLKEKFQELDIIS